MNPNRSAVGDKVYVECATSMGAGSTGLSCLLTDWGL